MSSRKIQSTRNYRLFERHVAENRPLNMAKHKRLKESMQLYGFLDCYPIVCYRDDASHLIVKDGQHRLMIAETLALPVYWVDASVDFDVAVVNSTSKNWQLKDYAQKHIASGHKAYLEGLEFSENHKLPIGTAFSLLSGTTTFGNCQRAFIDGSWKVKERNWANAVAGIYGPLVLMAPSIGNARFIEACMSVCRVADFDAKRLLGSAERCREKLIPYSTKDAYLDMLESIYNFGRKQLVGLKSAAIMAMRERSAVVKSQKKASASRNGTAAAACA